jgi:hypothetical protein
LENLDIDLDHGSLCRLLRLSENPALRERIYTICLYADPIDVNTNIDCKKIEEIFRREEDIEAFRTSSEAAYLLAECFENLKNAKNLQRIELCSGVGHSLILNALSIAGFSRKLAHFPVEPNSFVQGHHSGFSSTPETFAQYIKGLHVQPFLSEITCSSAKLSSEQKIENARGLHLKDYRPATSDFLGYLSALATVDNLELGGCRISPELRLCHGCDDLFTKNISCTTFLNLSVLAITAMFISGSRLRRFIKSFAGTLVQVDMTYTMLTDGTWRSVSQGLIKCPRLERLKFNSLRQKSPANDLGRPSEYARNSRVNLTDRDQVYHFLKILIAYFSTIPYLNAARFKRQYPRYYETKLFQLPEVVQLTGGDKAVAAIEEYADV